jgi:hypothetical protein
MTACMGQAAWAQQVWDYVPPRGYVAYKVLQVPVIDGKPDPVWDNAPWSEPFNDIEGADKPTPRFRTRMKMLWDETYLYVFAEMEEPHVWGYQTQRDATIYVENDFEMFIKPSALTPQYGEFEMNALGTPWDLFFMRPYRSGADYMVSWDMRDMKIGVHVQGTINDPADRDTGWCVEVAFPWSALKELGRKRALRDGDQWRINFSRVEWHHVITPEGKYVRQQGPNGALIPEANWTWSPQRVIQMHEPEYWGYVQLSDQAHGDVPFKRPQEEPIMSTLFYLFRAKKANMKAASMQALIGHDTIVVKGMTMKAALQDDPFGFHISLTHAETGETYVIDELEKIRKM